MMFRFSCFPAHIPSHRQHKRTVRLSGEAMGKGPEDSPPNKPLRPLSGLRTASVPCFITEGEASNKTGRSMTDDDLPIKRDCKSDELDGKYTSDYGINLHSFGPGIKKSLSLGNILNWEERSVAVADDINSRARALPDKYQQLVPPESAQVGSDFTKNISIFSIGGPQPIEKEDADKDDVTLSFVADCSDPVPCVFRHIIPKSSSLSRLGSLNQSPVSDLPRSRSAEDLNTCDPGKTCTRREFGRQMGCEERDKIHAENLADENYNYVDSAKHWIVPETDGAVMGVVLRGETSVQPWDEAPSVDFKLERVEQWVTNLQYTGSLEETDLFSDRQESSKLNTLIDKPVAAKFDVGVVLGAEAAKRYISSLNPSATTAQLSNLGLVVIPFLSAFVSLKALNLSGNAIMRITAGAIPRGLHILNLSKNSISTIEGLRDLTRLRVLDLSYNRILRIGHGLAGCSSLKELYLAGNKISEVDGLHRLLKLNILDLRFNKISTTKCLGQLAANFNCLHALSLEGNPAQKNVGDEPLKKYVVSLLPNLTYYNRLSVKVGTMKDGTDRSARLGIGSHQMDRGARQEVKNMRKGTHGVVMASHRRDHQGAGSSKHVRPGQSGMRSAQQLSVLKSDFSVHKSRSDGNLRAL